jgi:hypothetical protein
MTTPVRNALWFDELKSIEKKYQEHFTEMAIEDCITVCYGKVPLRQITSILYHESVPLHVRDEISKHYGLENPLEQ